MIKKILGMLVKREGLEAKYIRRADYAYTVYGTDQDLPPVPISYMIHRHSELINRLYMSSGLSQEDFDRLILPVVERLAGYMQLLPASQDHHHAFVGGLFQHSLEVSVVAARLTKGHSFGVGLTGGSRIKARKRWPVACVLSALQHDLGKVLHDVHVISSSSNKWNPFEESLHAFAMREDSYRVVWNRDRIHKRHEQASISLVGHIMGRELQSWLWTGDENIYPAMINCISGFGDSEFPVITEIVSSADKESVKTAYSRPKKPDQIQPIADPSPASADEQGPIDQQSENSPIGTNATDIFVSCLQEMVDTGQWLVNKKDARRGIFWFGNGSVWASWPALFNRLSDVYESRGFKSYPRNKDIFLKMLIKAGIVSEESGEYTSSIKIIIDGKSITLNMARICHVDICNYITSLPDNGAIVARDIPDELLNQSGKANDSKQPGEDELVASTTTTNPQDRKSWVKNYIKNLDNKDLHFIRSKGEAGDFLEEVCSRIAKGLLISRYGLHKGYMFLSWPDVPNEIGDPKNHVLEQLNKSRLLIEPDETKYFKTARSGISKADSYGTCVVLKKNITRRLLRSYRFDEEFNLPTPEPTPEPTGTSSDFCESPLKEQAIIASPRSAPQQSPNRGKNSRDFPADSFLETLDQYLCSNLDRYGKQVRRERELVVICGLAEIYVEMCNGTDLTKLWLPQVFAHDGIEKRSLSESQLSKHSLPRTYKKIGKQDG